MPKFGDWQERLGRLLLLDVLQAFEPPHPLGHYLLVERGYGAGPRTGSCGLQQLFNEAEDLVRCTFASVALDPGAAHRVTAPPLRDTPAQ